MEDPQTEQLPSSQKPAFYPSQGESEMDVKVTCLPPLGQATPIARNCHSVRFAVLLETSTPSLLDEGEPRVCLWHNHGGHYDWAELSLHPSSDYENVMLLQRPQDRSITRFWYTAELPGLPKHAHVVNFTVKFKVATSQGWRWVKDSTGIDDGELHYQSMDYQKHIAYELKYFFSNLSPEIKVQSERSDTDDTLLYSLTCPVSTAQGQQSGYQHHQLGLPNHMSRWFAEVRLWSPWLAPRQGRGKLALDKDGVLLSFLRTDGLHVVCLAISGVEDLMTTFLSSDDGSVIIKGRNDRAEVGSSRVLVAVADSFEVANAAVFYHARKIVREYGTFDADAETTALMEGNVKPDWIEEWYDGFTYCTWNGLGQDLTADKIYHALDDLAKEDINITNLIIDDNWQSLSAGDTQFKRGWDLFEANKKGFPDGLKVTTSMIRKKHPNVNHIAVWHAIFGYWGGIAPDGWIAKNYKTIEVEKESGVTGGKFTVVAAEDAKRLYDDFYRFLSENGVDAVKTDAQFFLDLLVNAPDRKALTTEYQDAWTLAHLRYFSSRAISCMSQTPSILFHSQLPTNKPRLLVRNSDDFFPEVPASHPWHVYCNFHNSLFTQHLNVLPDLDMFQTEHPWASFHAAARCISGGPIYFTDSPGQHDIKLIRQMTAQTVRGKTIILRPQCVGKALDPYNAFDALALLKVGTYCGMARTGTGILGVFNVSHHHISEFVELASFPGTDSGEYIVSSFSCGSISKPMSCGSEQAMVGVELNAQGWEILTAHPLQHFKVNSQPVSVAVMGLLGKMTGCAAVTRCDMHVEGNGRLRVLTSLKALGVLGLYISSLESRDVEKDFMVMISGKPIPMHCVQKSETSSKVLEIDVGGAWKESGEDPGWNNDVHLEIFIH